MTGKWKIALEKFLEGYEEDDDIIGAVLYDNYEEDNLGKKSSINIQIILSGGCTYRKIGSKKIGNFLVKYAMTPYYEIENDFKNDYSTGKSTITNMFGYGKIIFDLEGKVKTLQEKALEYLDKPLRVISNSDLQKNSYYIWNLYDELTTSLEIESECFYLIYYELITLILDSYCGFKEIAKLPKTWAYQILTDNNFRVANNVFNVPEKAFIDFYKNCFIKDSKINMIKSIKFLMDYYYQRTGSFNIENFELIENLEEKENDKY